jgi:hypothetical protein
MCKTMKSLRGVAVLLAGTLAVLALGTGVASAATNGTNRPLEGSGTLTGPTDASGNYDVTGLTVQSHLGRTMVEVVGNLNSASFVATLTAANGDTYTSVPVSALTPSNVCPALPNGIFNVPYHIVQAIIGGTGRFAGASGSIDTTGCFGLDTAGNLTITFTDEGTITY